ncbi:serine/threonine-protein kinase, partial [Actinocorallia lasiicapitis]
MEPLVADDPRRLGSINILGRLGRGGMGQVYYGYGPDYEAVAVKVIRAELAGEPEVKARFLREIEALRSVQSPTVAGLVDAFEDETETPWLAMEYVRGVSLKDLVKERGHLLEPAHAAALGVVLCDALEAIHAAGLLHRDLAPGNVLLGRNGPRVIDLGLVRDALPQEHELTLSGAVLGTPAFMPPEQVRDPRRVTAAADLYMLGGAVLWAVTGHAPYAAASLMALCAKVMDESSKPDLAGLPAAVEPLIAALLGKDPAARPTLPEVRAGLHALATVDGTP